MSKFLFVFLILTIPSVANESLEKIATNQKNDYTNIQIKKLIKKIEKKLPRTEISVTNVENVKPEYSILTVQPILFKEESLNTFFWQGSGFIHDNLDRQTINFGLGYRKMVFEKKLLLGTNLFYDHEFPYNHGRTSLGLELRTTVGEINANRYWSTRDWVTANSNNTERALSGHDIEASVPLPYMNWANLSYNKFHWYGKEIENIGGTKTSLSAIIPQLPNLLIRIDRTKYNSDAIDNTDSLTLSYVFKASEKKQVHKSFFNNKAYELSSMENERFNLVNRENEILKEVNNDGVFNFKGV